MTEPPKPKRIQRKRTKGWRMPPNCVSCTRPGKFGNPYKGPGAVGAFREMITQMQKANRGEGGLLPIVGPDYELAIRQPIQKYASRLVESLPELRGKDLMCFCKEDAPWCHVDVLLELANA